MNWKLFVVLSCAGLPGVFALGWLALPLLVEGRTLPAPMWVLSVASSAQSAVLLALAVFAGAALAAKVGLRAPVFSALAGSAPVLEQVRPQLLPGIVAGLAGAALIWLFARYSPDALTQLQSKFSLPLIARVLYGGITEELLVRWGLMTLLVWLFWRYRQGMAGEPTPMIVWIAIVLSSVIFGLGHLPAAAAFVGQLSMSVGAYIVAGNTVFGLIAGYVYWRYGLESAIIAHALAHVVSFILVR